MMDMKKAETEEYTDEEIERRAREIIKRARTDIHKPQKEFVGTTPRAQAATRQKAKAPPKS